METPVTFRRRPPVDPAEAAKSLLLIGIAAAIGIPLWESRSRAADAAILYAFGWIAVWRYGWWATHLVRSQIYSRFVFPRLRRDADSLWAAGWRPGFVHCVVATYRERPDVTERMLDSIARECADVGCPARIYIAIADPEDQRVIEAWFARRAAPALPEVLVIWVNKPGKRHALASALRAVRRCGAQPDDIAILMDGDSIMADGALRRCVPLLALRRNLGAVTTNEAAVVEGPKWIDNWYQLRFAQRRLVMGSHSLSRKVLTLTGRFSVYRAGNVVQESFIRLVESDTLDHWLWGRFNLLSGDDKSTWYWMLRSGQEMLYVPDALVITVERIEGPAAERAKQNLLRWSGNMLRNGRRALALGPRRCGLFIWWCLVDQRLSIWTAFVGPVTALLLSFIFGAKVLAAYIVWIVGTRLLVSLVLWDYGARFSAALPFLVFANQLAAASVKVFIIFRLARQRWANRGNQQSSAGNDALMGFRNAMAAYVTLMYLAVFVFLISVRLGVVDLR